MKWVKRKEERKINFIEVNPINDKEKYNICIEATANPSDVTTKKIGQLYKMTICFKFLYNMYGILNGKQKCLSSSFSYFMDKTKFINFGHKLIFLVITNGNKEYFNNISKIISQNEGKNFNDNNNYTKTNDNNNQIKLLQETNKAFNIYFLYYPKYDEIDIKELNNKINDKEDGQLKE